jgi:hypothetical protein
MLFAGADGSIAAPLGGERNSMRIGLPILHPDVVRK